MDENNYASMAQKKMFFALGHELGYDPEILKERAKKYFKLETFTKATKDQLCFLIDKLIAKQQEKEKPAEIEENIKGLVY